MDWGSLAIFVVHATEKSATDLIKAPDVLEFQTVEKWLSGSVWTLVCLNLLALGLFICSAVLPQIKAAIAKLNRMFSRGEPRAQIISATMNVPTPTSTEVTTEIKSEEVVAATAEPTTPSVVETLTEVQASPIEATPEPIPESTAAATPPAAEEIQETFVEPTAPDEITEVTAVLSDPIPAEEPTEVIGAPTTPAPATDTPDKSSFDSLLKSALNSSDKTEEIPIFDTAMLDEVMGASRKEKDSTTE